MSQLSLYYKWKVEIVINVLLEMMDARSRHARMMMAVEKGHFSGFNALNV